uniref:mitogen-activated protein kinase kinase n=1 Tax=Angiostrongylus cantonensis TaxID=6313 RepID=A0A0K0DQM9_ANGCA
MFSTVQEENVLRSSTLSTGTLKFPDDDVVYTFTASDLRDYGKIGSGNFGSVYKMVHNESGKEMAVKRIRCNNISSREQEKIIREHDTIMRSEKCTKIVKYFGAILHEGDCWICMEFMDISLDILYKRVYNLHHTRFHENVIGHIAVIDALDYLKSQLKIIHRGDATILPDKSGTNFPTPEGWKAWWPMGAFHVRLAVAPPTIAPQRALLSDGIYIN